MFKLFLPFICEYSQGFCLDEAADASESPSERIYYYNQIKSNKVFVRFDVGAMNQIS